MQGPICIYTTKSTKLHQKCMQSCRLHGNIFPDSRTLRRCEPGARLTSPETSVAHPSCNFSRWLAWWQRCCCRPWARRCTPGCTSYPLPSCWSWQGGTQPASAGPGEFEGWGKVYEADDDKDGDGDSADEDEQDDPHLVAVLRQEKGVERSSHHIATASWLLDCWRDTDNSFLDECSNSDFPKEWDLFLLKIQLHLSKNLISYLPLHPFEKTETFQNLDIWRLFSLCIFYSFIPTLVVVSKENNQNRIHLIISYPP